MKCVIPGQNVKVFGRGLHALAKVGENLYLEPQEDGLALRTMNSSRSAFASFLFDPVFFSSYVTRTTRDVEEEDLLDYRCKITMKSAIWVFKSISSLEKTVNSASIEICPDETKVKVTFYCKFGIVKAFTIHFLECDSLKAKYDSSSCSNHLTARARVLSDAALNFLTNQEEVTMIASPINFLMKNYLDSNDLEKERKAVHTALTMQPAEFEVYSIGQASSVTYCLKELRSIIGFADAFSLPLSVDFDTGGQPIVFSLSWPQTCEAVLVMATLAEEEEEDKATDFSSRSHKRKKDQPQPSPSGIQHNRDEASMPLTQNPRVSTQRLDGSISHHTPSLTPIPRMEVITAEEEETVNSSHIGNNGDVRTPPSKRTKYLFKKCFDATFDPRGVDGAHRILAPDSDEEGQRT